MYAFLNAESGDPVRIRPEPGPSADGYYAEIGEVTTGPTRIFLPCDVAERLRDALTDTLGVPEAEAAELATLRARVDGLEAMQSILRHYLVKTANCVGRPTSDPLTEPHAVEEVGEGVLRALAELRAEREAAQAVQDQP